MKRTGSSMNLLALHAAILILLLYGTSTSNARYGRFGFPLELASCFFAMGGGLKQSILIVPQPHAATPECIALYKEYFKEGGPYWKDLETALEAGKPILENEGDFAQMVIFDIDETTLSNLPLYEANDFVEPEFEQWLEWIGSGELPAIPATLKFYKEIIARGYSVSFVSGRFDTIQNVTAANLFQEGYGKPCTDAPVYQGSLCYVDLLMRAEGDLRDYGVIKAEARSKLKEAGFNLVASVGDQWSDLVGTDSPPTIIKMPNPRYYFA